MSPLRVDVMTGPARLQQVQQLARDVHGAGLHGLVLTCLLYTSPSPRD